MRKTTSLKLLLSVFLLILLVPAFAFVITLAWAFLAALFGPPLRF